MMMATCWLLNEVGANMHAAYLISRVLDALNSIKDGTMYGSWTLLCAALQRS